MTPPNSAPFGTNKLFLGTDDDTLAELAAIPRRVDSSSGTLIFQEGDAADCFYLIADGCVCVSKRGRGGKQETLSHFRRDDFFGEMAIFDPAPRSAQAATTEATLLGRVDEAGFRRMLELAPLEISSNLTRETIRRLRRMDSLLIAELLEAERLSLVGSMAGSIIHDFKNPMNVVMGAVQMLERRSDDPALLKYAGMIRRSVDRMLSMAQELLDFSRGQASLELAPVSIPDLLAELDEQALQLLPGSGIDVERNVGYTGMLTMDRSRFIRLLLNLVRNAAEAMPGGGVMRIGVERGEGSVLFTVEDTGGGIPEEILPMIFEPFVTRGKKGGTGLGMAIAKAVVDAHGGTISISSTLGTGTCVSVVIPERPSLEAPV